MAELLILVVVGLVLVVLVICGLVLVSRRMPSRPFLPDFAAGSRVVSTGPDGQPEVSGTLVRIDNAYAVVDVAGHRRFVPRGSLRPALGRPDLGGPALDESALDEPALDEPALGRTTSPGADRG